MLAIITITLTFSVDGGRDIETYTFTKEEDGDRYGVSQYGLPYFWRRLLSHCTTNVGPIEEINSTLQGERI